MASERLDAGIRIRLEGEEELQDELTTLLTKLAKQTNIPLNIEAENIEDVRKELDVLLEQIERGKSVKGIQGFLSESDAAAIRKRIRSVAGEVDKLTEQTEKTPKAVKQTEEAFEQFGKESQRAMVKTSLASQEMIRIVQDAPFGLFGVTNNIQAMFDQITNQARRTGNSISSVFRESLKALFTGPMAIGLLVALVTSLLLHWDKVLDAYDSARVKLGLITKEQKGLNAATKEFQDTLEEIEGMDFFREVIGEIPDENLIKAATQIRKKFLDPLEAEIDTLTDSLGIALGGEIPASMQERIDAQQEFAELVRKEHKTQEDINRLRKLDAEMRGEVNMGIEVGAEARAKVEELEAKIAKWTAAQLDLIERQARLRKKEDIQEQLGPDLWETDDEDGGGSRRKKTWRDLLTFRIEISEDLTEKLAMEAQKRRLELLAEAKQLHADGVLSWQEYGQRVIEINQQTSRAIKRASAIDTQTLTQQADIIETRIGFTEKEREETLKTKNRVIQSELQRYNFLARIARKEVDLIAWREEQKRQQYWMTVRAIQQSVGFMGQSFQNMAMIMGDASEEGFEQNKGWLVAGASANAISAGIGIYESYATSGIPAPFNMILAATNSAAVLTGLMAQVRQIEQMGKGGSGGGGQTGQFTALNPTATSRRAANLEQHIRRQSVSRSTQQREGLRDEMRRTREAIQDQKVILEDRTSEQVVNRGQNKSIQLNR